MVGEASGGSRSPQASVNLPMSASREAGPLIELKDAPPSMKAKTDQKAVMPIMKNRHSRMLSASYNPPILGFALETRASRHGAEGGKAM